MINIDNILSINMPTNFPIIKILIEQSEYKHYNVRKKKNGQLSAYKREKKRKIINNYMNDNFLLMFL